jgi:hypothetical protein
MRLLILSVLILLFFGASCDDDTNDSRSIIIMTGKACGWCAGADSLMISNDKIRYEFSGVCGKPNKSITENTQPEEWRELRASLNWDEFKKVNVNTCALCADGCDTWIRILNGGDSHYIRFTSSSPEIEPIKVFVDKLKALHQAFQQK